MLPMKYDRERHPADPRNAPGYRARGPRRFSYGWSEIAGLLDVSEKRAQNLASLGRFDPKSLVSVCAFVNLWNKDRARFVGEGIEP